MVPATLPPSHAFHPFSWTTRRVIGGLETAAEAIESVIEGKYPGKVVIFPQIRNMPLMSLKELQEHLPEVAAKLGKDLMWTNEAEEVLIEKMWEKPE